MSEQDHDVAMIDADFKAVEYDKIKSHRLEESNSPKQVIKRAKINDIQKRKDQVTKELNELKSAIEKRRSVIVTKDESSDEEEDFVDLLDNAFDTTTTGMVDSPDDKIKEIDNFLREHQKIDEKLINTKQSKLFLIKSKSKQINQSNKTIRKSSSVGSFGSSTNGSNSIYNLDNDSKASLPGKLIRRMSSRKSGLNHSNNNSIIATKSQNEVPETLKEVSSESEKDDDKEIITYKKVFKDNKELSPEEILAMKRRSHNPDQTIMDDTDENIETFQFQFEFSKIKLNEEKLKFSTKIDKEIKKQNDFELTSTTLISNSQNGKIVTTTIRPKQKHHTKGLFGLGIGNGIANIYSTLFGWKKK